MSFKVIFSLPSSIAYPTICPLFPVDVVQPRGAAIVLIMLISRCLHVKIKNSLNTLHDGEHPILIISNLTISPILIGHYSL